METSDKVYGELYSQILRRYKGKMAQLNDGESRYQSLSAQTDLVATIFGLAKTIRSSKDTRDKKVFLELI